MMTSIHISPDGRHNISKATATSILRPLASEASDWLQHIAFPLWADSGMDRRNGGCHESLTVDGSPSGADRRAFVQARQAYCFCAAGRLGWEGPWRAAALHATEFLLGRFRRFDGSFRHKVSVAGVPLDEKTDLYDQAFAIFALAHVYRTCGRDPAVREAAEQVLAYLVEQRMHPIAGFVDQENGRQRQNPHMHLLEAALAWCDEDPDGRWNALAKRLGILARDWLFDRETGALLEYFSLDWLPEGGRDNAVIEPGHQYEWIYLLRQLRDGSGLASEDALLAIAEDRGRDGLRGVAVHDIDIQGGKVGRHARIWAQTERLRTAVTLLGHWPAQRHAGLMGMAVESMMSLRAFLDVPVRGLWRDVQRADGSFDIGTLVPASTFYHIVTGFEALIAFVAHRDGEGAAPSPSRG